VKADLDSIIKQNIDELETVVKEDSRNCDNTLSPDVVKAKASLNSRHQKALSFTKPNGLFSSPHTTQYKQVGFGSTTEG